jgi:predicted HTH domain antitoxin
VTNVVKGYVQYFLDSSALIKRYMEAIEPEEQSMKSIEILVPEEIVNLLGSEEAVRQEAREAFIFDLVRRGKVSKGKAAELLGICLWNLPELIAQYQMPWFSYSQTELERDLETLRALKGDEGNTT